MCLSNLHSAPLFLVLFAQRLDAALISYMTLMNVCALFGVCWYSVQRTEEHTVSLRDGVSGDKVKPQTLTVIFITKN